MTIGRAAALWARMVSLAAAVAIAVPPLLAVSAVAVPAATPKPAPSQSSITGEPIPAPGKGPAQKLTFGIKPRDAAGAPTRSDFAYLLAPSATTNDAVSIYNFSLVPLNLTLYATDGYTNQQGSFALNSAAQKADDIGNWIKVLIPKGSVLRVPARTKVDVPFSLKIPFRASPGDHAGGIVLSLRGRTKNKDGNVVAVDSRVSTAIKVRVTGEVRPQLSVENLAAKYDGEWKPWAAGSAAVSFTIRNTGNIVQAGRQVVSLDGPFGVRKEVSLDVPSILPGSAVNFLVPISDVWPLVRYSATVGVFPVAVSGDPTGTAVRASVDTWAIPWPQIITLILIVLSLWYYRRRRALARRGRHANQLTQHPPLGDKVLVS